MSTTVLGTYEKWKQFLGDRVRQARAMGMSDDAIKALAKEIGDFLANKIDPKNNEERVLRELWAVCDENEKRMLAGIMVKLVD